MYLLIFSVLVIWNIFQQFKIKGLSNSVKKLNGDYDKLCNVLGGDINVEDVKKKLEGVKSLAENNEFPFTEEHLAEST